MQATAQPVGNLSRDFDSRRSELDGNVREVSPAAREQAAFLANMSHELRTPLNSLLILSKLLSDNLTGNLTEQQVTFAQTIHGAGSDLLALINDIVDWARIESGGVTPDADEVSLQETCTQLEQCFRPVAQRRGLELVVTLADGLPRTIATDAKRLHQVLRNLLANAFKVTERGTVSLVVSQAAHGAEAKSGAAQGESIAFAVTDTGAPLSEELQRLLLTPPERAWSKLTRAPGAVTLRLSLIGEVARLLGGELRHQNAVRGGNTLTLRLPVVEISSVSRRSQIARPSQVAMLSASPPVAPEPAAEPGERSPPLLIVCEDETLVRAMRVRAERHGFPITTSARTFSDVSPAARVPSALALDLRGGGLDGWVALERIKHDLASRHVPVMALAHERHWCAATRMGAHVLEGPEDEHLATRLAELDRLAHSRERHLLVCQPDDLPDFRAAELLGGADTRVRLTSLAGLSLALQERRFDAVVVGLSGAHALEALESALPRTSLTPIIVHAETGLGAAMGRIEAMRDGRLPLAATTGVEQLLWAGAKYLHRPAETFEPAQRELLLRGAAKGRDVGGRRVLIVDDDVRSIFAITSALERYAVKVSYADSGREGLAQLGRDPLPDAVCLEMRLRDLDGYELLRQLRRDERLAELPLIAVTANAMAGDRESCLQAGASHYIAKPVDTENLISALCVAMTAALDRSVKRDKLG